MDKQNFEVAMFELSETYPRVNLPQKTIDIWYKRISTKGYIFTDLSKAIEKLQDTNYRMPSLADIIKACQEQQTRRLEDERYREKQKLEPSQMKTGDMTKLSKLCKLVQAGIKGDPDAIKELGWNR